MSSSLPQPACPFCSIASDKIIGANAHAYAIHDTTPVAQGHVLVIPRRHAASYFDLSSEEQIACWNLVNKMHDLIKGTLKPDGFNVGINVNAAAGQTLWHVHIHLIPRYQGDVETPRGGVRAVIPSKQNY
jgi:diadenosine tetraphosphate (Ap4A) HIT family hydrolase